mmetsp:Transcript_25144/g.47046  ORF Transcript_25144/g.47046 Transcript_25144/m.47046 type:complete len:255 (-) Transcript_25144:92-856(-)
MSANSAHAAVSKGQARAAPLPSPSRRSRSSSGLTCRCCSQRACGPSAERWANTHASSTPGRNACASATAAVVMKPSTTMTRRPAAAAMTLPAIVRISKPPSAAPICSGVCAVAFAARAWASTADLCARPESSRPVPRPTQSASGMPVRRAIKRLADEVLPIPISPSSSALPGRRSTRAMPLPIACSACAIDMAGPVLASAVPAAMRRSTAPAASGASTPQSAIVNARLCWRASTETAAPPASILATICGVTSRG